MLFKIDINDKHIGFGIRKDSKNCAIALAVKDTASKFAHHGITLDDVYVTNDKIYLFCNSSDKPKVIPMNAQVYNLRINFDLGLTATPLSFYIDLYVPAVERKTEVSPLPEFNMKEEVQSLVLAA